MLNKNLIGDWSTPKLASERHPLSPNISAHMMKKGISKSGSNIGETNSRTGSSKKSKEHVIDNSIETSHTSYGSVHPEIYPPKSSVHMSSKRSFEINKESAADGLNPNIFWATMKTQSFGKNEPFGTATDSKPSIIPGRDSGEKLSSRGGSNGTGCGSVEKVMERLVSYNSYEGNVMRSNRNLDMNDKKNHQQYETSELRNNAITSNSRVMEPRRQMYDTDAKYENNLRSNMNMTVSDQYVISAKQYSNLDPNSQMSLMKVNSVQSASSLAPVTSKNTVSRESCGKWDQVINAKDNLIKKKDNIIERQKQTIEQLQSHIMVTEERISQNSSRLAAQRKDEERVMEKLGSSENQISQLKAQLQHVNSSKQDEIERLQMKLGETEYELQKLQKGFKDVGRGQAKEIAELKKKIEERDQSDLNLKNSLEALQDALKEERRKAQSLKQYLQELPTTEEHAKTNQQIKAIKLEKVALEEKIEHLEERLKEAKNNIKQRDAKVEEERQSKENLKTEMKRLTEYLNRYKEREKDGPVTMEEFDEVKWEKERVKADCERLKKLLEQKHKKMKALHEQSQTTVKALEERLAQEENTVNVLRKEIESRDVSINDLKASTKQIQDKNQDLMRENMALKDILEELERLTSAEVQEAHNQVQKELACCVSEINFLIDLCSQIAEGRDPNMSALLGIKGHAELESDGAKTMPTNPFSAEAAKGNLLKIRELRSEIDKLRTFVSDKYAEDVGNNCLTQ